MSGIKFCNLAEQNQVDEDRTHENASEEIPKVIEEPQNGYEEALQFSRPILNFRRTNDGMYITSHLGDITAQDVHMKATQAVPPEIKEDQNVQQW